MPTQKYRLPTSDEELRGQLNGARYRHALALALERPTLEDAVARLANAEALIEHLHLLMTEAVRQKVVADAALDMAIHMVEQMPAAIASKAGKRRAELRYAKDPKQDAKRFVRECWDRWQLNPNQYESQIAFATDMMEKVGEDAGGPLKTPLTITNKWIPEFRRAVHKT
jgi:hypothetical protein